MAQRAREIEQEFIATTKEKTGKSLDEWMAYLQGTGLSKTKELINHIKSEHGLNHMQASMLASIYLNDGKPVHDYDVLFAKLFDGKEAMRPIYEQVRAIVDDQLPDTVEMIPTKTYVSIEGERVFACAKINKSNVRVGLDLDVPFDDTLVAAKGLGAMPNISHMVEITDASQVDKRLGNLLQQAYDNRH